MADNLRDPYGNLNPLKTEYVASLIKEVNYRMSSPDFDDEIEPIPEDKKGKIKLQRAELQTTS